MKRAVTFGVSLSIVALTALTWAQGGGPPARPQGEQPVSITPIAGVVAAGATWTRAWQGTDNADGLVAAPDGAVLFAQEQPNRVRRLSPDDQVAVFVEDTHGAGSLALDSRGRLFAVQRTCTDPGRQGPPCTEPTTVAIIHPAADRKVLASSYQGRSLGRVNDLVVDLAGGAYFTSGGAFYVSPAGEVREVGENLRTNGIMLSRDGRTLYVTNGATIVAFDVLPDGSTRNQREFARLQAGGTGDGLAIDADGRLYVTSQPGVQVFSVEGAYLGLIPSPRSVITVAFAGPGKRTLYVVGSGARNADGTEFSTPAGIRNNAKTIYRIPVLTQGFAGRAK